MTSKNKNGSDSVGTLYREPMEGLRFTMINTKKSEDIPGEAYILSSNANARASNFFGWFYYSRRNKTQFDTLYVSKQIYSP